MDGDGGETLLKWLVLIAIADDDVLAQAIIPHRMARSRNGNWSDRTSADVLHVLKIHTCCSNLTGSYEKRVNTFWRERT